MSGFVLSNHHQHRFVFWYTRRTQGIRSQTSYEDNMKKIAEFSTVSLTLVFFFLMLYFPTSNSGFSINVKKRWKSNQRHIFSAATEFLVYKL
jgi:hypothetical protein